MGAQEQASIETLNEKNRLCGLSEGPGWFLPDFDARWEDPVLREGIVDVARALESEPSVLGASAHLLAIARRPQYIGGVMRAGAQT